MAMLRTKRGRLIGVLVGAALMVGGGVAGAAADKSGPSAQAAGAVPGWQYVTSANLSNPTNTQTRGQVFCPEGRPVTGGGAFGNGSLGQSINSSYPIDDADADLVSDDGWEVWMNNTGPATSFQVWAVCRIPQSTF